MVNESCRCVPELSIAADLPTEVWIHYLASGVHNAQEETTRVQLELNLHIAELQMKAQPSTALEIREQCTNAIVVGMEEIGGEVRDYTNMLEEALKVFTTL